jgi:hypothetical protein
MLPKPRQLRAPWPKQPGNAFQALVDLPEDGSNSTFDGRDGKVDGTDENTVEIAPQHVSTAAALYKTTRETTRDRFYDWTSDLTRFTQNAYLSDFSEERGVMDLKEYCTVTHFNVRMIEYEHGNTLHVIEEQLEQIEHLLPDSFDIVLTKLTELRPGHLPLSHRGDDNATLPCPA